MKAIHLLTATSLWAFAGGAAQAACDLQAVNVISGGAVIRYDPFDQSATQADLGMSIRSEGCQDARFEVALVPLAGNIGAPGALSASDGMNEVDVRIAFQGRDAQVVSDPAMAFASPGPAGRLSATGGVSGQPVRLVLPYGQIVPPGRYRAEALLLARAVDGDGEASQTVETRVQVEIDVEPSFRLAAGVERRLFLGELTPGAQSEPLAFNAFANVGYELRVRSEREWILTPDGVRTRDGVPYEVSISGRTVDRTSRESELDFAPPGRDGVRNHRLVARALPFEAQPAGEYRDWITIEISPRIS